MPAYSVFSFLHLPLGCFVLILRVFSFREKLSELRREKQKLVEKIMDQYRVLEPSMPSPASKAKYYIRIYMHYTPSCRFICQVKGRQDRRRSTYHTYFIHVVVTDGQLKLSINAINQLAVLQCFKYGWRSKGEHLYNQRSSKDGA